MQAQAKCSLARGDAVTHGNQHGQVMQVIQVIRPLRGTPSDREHQGYVGVGMGSG